MRPKIVLLILVPAIFLAGALFFLNPGSSTPATHMTPATAVMASPTPSPTPALSPVPTPVVVQKTPTPTETRAVISAEEDRLYAWSTGNDPAALSNILNDLNSPEKEIRMAAIEAAKQFDNTNAIPVLKAAAANAADNQEAIAMLEAADFLAVPDVTLAPKSPNDSKTPEQLQAEAQERAKEEARRQARQQIQTQNQNPQSPLGQSAGPAPGSTAPGTAGN